MRQKTLFMWLIVTSQALEAVELVQERAQLLKLMERVQITHKTLGSVITHPLTQAFKHPVATLESSIMSEKATQRLQRLALLQEKIAWQLGMLELGHPCTADLRQLSQEVSQELQTDETSLTLDQIGRYSCIALCAGWTILKLNDWAIARNESIFSFLTNSVQDYFTTAWRNIKDYHTLNKLFKNQLKEMAQLGLAEYNYDTLYSATELLTRQADQQRSAGQLLELRSNIIDQAFGNNIKPLFAYNCARYVAGYGSAFFTALHSYYVQADLLVTKGKLVTTVIVPAAVTAIVGYKAIEATINFSYGTGVIIPLTELLKEFRALIDHYYLITQRDARFYGWRAFLLYKLHTYAPRIRGQRETFEQELRRLELYSDSKDYQLAVINSLALLLKE